MRLRALQLARRGDFWKQATDLWGSSARYQALNNPHGWHGSLLLRTFWGGSGNRQVGKNWGALRTGREWTTVVTRQKREKKKEEEKQTKRPSNDPGERWGRLGNKKGRFEADTQVTAYRLV